MNDRLTFRKISSELLAQFDLERGLFRNFVDLTIRPGAMLHGYLDGSRRSQYVRAVSYLGLAAAVSMVQLAIYDPTNEIIVEEIAKIEASETAITWEKESWETFGNTYENYKEFLIYASVPLLAVSTMLWFVFWRFRYAEHLVIASFVIVHQTFLFNVPVNIFAYIYEPLRGEATQYAIAFVSFIYQIWVYTQICWPYRIDLRITSIWRAVLAVLTWMFLFAALLTLAVLVFL